MQPMAADTPLHVEAEIMALLRTMTPAQKGLRITELCAALDELGMFGIRLRPRPMNEYVQLALRRIPEPQQARALPLLMELSMTSPADPVAIAVHVGQVLEQAGVRSYVGGSFASSIFGDFRLTRDIDIVIQAPNRSQLKALVVNLQQDFTFLEADVYEAHARRADSEATFVSFAMYHRQTGYQVDVFLAGNTPYERLTFQRMIEADLVPGKVWIPSVEDAIIAKLRWYAISPSDQQWRDVQGMLRVQQSDVDLNYLREWGDNLGIRALIEAAIIGEQSIPPSDASQLRLL
jgi:hypothetical protein